MPDDLADPVMPRPEPVMPVERLAEPVMPEAVPAEPVMPAEGLAEPVMPEAVRPDPVIPDAGPAEPVIPRPDPVMPDDLADPVMPRPEPVMPAERLAEPVMPLTVRAEPVIPRADPVMPRAERSSRYSDEMASRATTLLASTNPFCVGWVPLKATTSPMRGRENAADISGVISMTVPSIFTRPVPELTATTFQATTTSLEPVTY
jgi:hypothetical protein